MTAPDIINFGDGVPGDTLTTTPTVTVITNADSGYFLYISGTDLLGNSESIDVTNLGFREGTTAYTNLASENTEILLASTSTLTDAAGDAHLIDSRLALPFVNSGLYLGTVTFRAEIR